MAEIGAAPTPLETEEFAALMAPFAPFEPAPRLAVAVSGGADSLALAILADRWARKRGGAVTALTVNHRLRPAATTEATQVAAWLGARDIDHHVLEWTEPRRERGIQAAARAARYRLLENWCAEAGVLHLLVAHHREDQAETLLLRLARGSGLDGLAGMARVAERAACRVLRPLLSVARARLIATLQAAGQSWIEDPSNQDRAYARARLRQAMPSLGEMGFSAERLAGAARHLGWSRAALERQVAVLLARAVTAHPAGYVLLDPSPLAAVPDEIGFRGLAAVLTMVGGATYPPRFERLERLYHGIRKGLAGGRTLGGCRVLPQRRLLLICREPAAVAAPVPAPPGMTVSWDGRFRLRLPAAAPPGLTLGALGTSPLEGDARTLPAVIRTTLPALRDDSSVVAVPMLGYVRRGLAKDLLGASELCFRPARSLTSAGFTVV